MRTLLIYTSLLFISTTLFAQQEGDEILGVWESGSGKARIKIDKSEDIYYGRIVWVREPHDENGNPKDESNNRDDKLKSKGLVGYRMLQIF